MKKKLSITLPDYIIDEMVGETDNKSNRIQELIIKGFLIEREEKLKKEFKDQSTTGPYCSFIDTSVRWAHA